MSANKRKRLHRRGAYHGADSSRKKNIAEKEENGVAMTRDKYAKMRARKNPEARYGKREARGAADAAKGRTQHDHFSERAPEPREGLPSGHIPGSFNAPSADLINADGSLKSASELRALLPEKDAPVITTCGSGVTAAILALGYARLGNWDVAVYDGSWTEWASDPSRPVATGAA